MERNLYDLLGLTRDASPEQIKKAYRKKALETHPDRLPPTSTETEKAVAAENFRSVNNAYEVLIEPKNRRLYDMHGVWPPPEHQDEHHHRSSSRYQHEPFHPFQGFSAPFPEPMFSFPFSSGGPFGSDRHHRHHHAHFGFTDPITLFNSIFADFTRGASPVDVLPFPPHHHHHHGHHPGESHSHSRRNSQSRKHEYSGNHSSDLEHHHYEDPGYPSTRRHTRSQGSSYPPTTSNTFFSSSSRGFASVGRWTQESKVTTTVNGVSQTVWKRTDSDGNVHVTKIYPDGREKYSVNGVEQPPQRQDRYIDRGDRDRDRSSHHTGGGGYHHHHHRQHSPTNDVTPGIPHSYGAGPHRSESYGPRSAPIRPGPDYRHHERERDRERVIPDPSMYDYEDQKRSWWRR